MSMSAPEFGQDNSEGGQGPQEVTQPADTAQPSVNPAWNDALGVIPSQLHSQVVPHFQKWDKNYQDSIQKVHSQYEPWKPIIDNGYTPEDVNFGISLIQALTNNPQELAAALNEWIEAENSSGAGIEQQGQNESTPQFPQNPEFDISQHPVIQQQDQALRAMAEILLSQRQAEQAAAADQELANEFETLREKFKDRGEFDEEFVLGVAMNDPNMDLNAAVEKYFEIQDKMLQQQRRPGPPVLGSGGAIPSGGIPRNLEDKDRRALVAQMLAQAQQNS
jgi:hypothetical protein